VRRFKTNLPKIKKIVNINKDHENNDFISDLKVLDRAYPEIDNEFIELEGVFGPEIIDELSINGIYQKTLCL
jgi:hypothetical protein